MKIALEYGKDFDIKRQTEYAVKGISAIKQSSGTAIVAFRFLDKARNRLIYSRVLKCLCLLDIAFIPAEALLLPYTVRQFKQMFASSGIFIPQFWHNFDKFFSPQKSFTSIVIILFYGNAACQVDSGQCLTKAGLLYSNR